MSWHWEEVNYTSWSHKIIREIVFQYFWRGKEFTIQLGEPTICGEASIALRRGRAIPTCCLSITTSWTAVQAHGCAASGTWTLRDIDADTLQQAEHQPDGDSLIVSDIVTSTPEGNLICKVLKKEVLSDFLTALHKLYWVRLSTIEAEKALETQRLRLEDSRDISTGSETNLLEEGSKEKPASNTGHELLAKVAPPDLRPSEGHWEERNLTTPALHQLQKFLNGISGKGLWAHIIDDERVVFCGHRDATQSFGARAIMTVSQISCLNGQCTVELQDIKISGEATMTLKGKKNFVTYEFNIKCQWKAISRTAEGVYMADAKGDLRVVNFSSLNLDDLRVEVDCDDFSHPARRRLLDAVRGEWSSFLEDELRRWVSNVFRDTDAL